jgi:hypothetical protein
VDWLIRFDLVARTTETLAGTNFGETQAREEAGRAIAGQGAPLRAVVLGGLDDLAFAPDNEEILYVADPSSGIVWRLDLVRDRAFVAAGRRLSFDEELETREPDEALVDPSQELNFPVAVAPVLDRFYIAELFDDQLLVVRPR